MQYSEKNRTKIKATEASVTDNVIWSKLTASGCLGLQVSKASF